MKILARVFGSILFTAVTIPHSSSAATIDVFSNRSSWLAASKVAVPNGLLVDDDMEGELEPGILRQSITLAGSNITFRASVGAVDEVDDFLFVQSTNDVLTDDGTGAYSASSVSGGMRSLAMRISNYPTNEPTQGFFSSAQEFSFDLPEATNAVSFDFAGFVWVNPQGNTGQRINILEQAFIAQGRFDTCCEGFFGAVSETLFSTVKFTLPGQGNYKKFEIGRVSYVSNPDIEISPVPVPASISFLAIGLLSLALIASGKFGKSTSVS